MDYRPSMQDTESMRTGGNCYKLYFNTPTGRILFVHVGGMCAITKIRRAMYTKSLAALYDLENEQSVRRHNVCEEWLNIPATVPRR